MKSCGANRFDIAVMTKACGREVTAGILICPSENAVKLAKEGTFGQIVTVGYSQSDTVTFSSRGESSLSVCFTRDISPVFGSSIASGEVVLEKYDEPLYDMMVSAVLRCIGVV